MYPIFQTWSALQRGIIAVPRNGIQLPPLTYWYRANFVSPQRLSFLKVGADVKSSFLAIWVLWPSVAHPAQSQHIRDSPQCHACVPCGTRWVNHWDFGAPHVSEPLRLEYISSSYMEIVFRLLSRCINFIMAFSPQPQHRHSFDLLFILADALKLYP